MGIHQVFVWTCDECGDQHTDEHGITADPRMHVLLPTPPEGWTMLSEKVCCPKHVARTLFITPSAEKSGRISPVLQLLMEIAGESNVIVTFGSGNDIYHIDAAQLLSSGK